MGFFQTKDPKTGEPRLGAGVYLIVCALMIGGVVLWHVRQHAHEPGMGNDTTAVVGPSNPTNVQTVAKAVAAHEETANVAEATDISRNIKSARGVEFKDDSAKNDANKTDVAKTDDMDTIQDTVELLRSNQEKAEREKAEAVAQAKAQAEAEASAEIEALKRKNSVTSSAEGSTTASNKGPNGAHQGPPGTGASNGSSNQASGISSDALTIYDSLHNAKNTIKEKVAVPTGFDTNDFLPRGTIFPVYILSTVQTVNQEDMVVLGVAENVVFQHKIQLPFGTHLLGTAAASNFEDRVMINVDTILYPDGKELPISAFLKDASDLSSGVKGYYIPQPYAVQMTPFVAEFIDVWTQSMADRFSNSHAVNGGTVYRSSLNNTSDFIRTLTIYLRHY